MRVPDNYDLFEMHEREEERRKKHYKEVEKLPFDDLKIEVAFYINEHEEDVEFLENFLKEHKFNYEKEVL